MFTCGVRHKAPLPLGGPATGAQANECEPPSVLTLLLRQQTRSNKTRSNRLCFSYYISEIRRHWCVPVYTLLSQVLNVLSDEEQRVSVA